MLSLFSLFFKSSCSCILVLISFHHHLPSNPTTSWHLGVIQVKPSPCPLLSPLNLFFAVFLLFAWASRNLLQKPFLLFPSLFSHLPSSINLILSHSPFSKAHNTIAYSTTGFKNSLSPFALLKFRFSVTFPKNACFHAFAHLIPSVCGQA